MAEDVRLFFRSGIDILNSEEMMKGQEGDEFETVREEMLLEVEAEMDDEAF